MKDVRLSVIIPWRKSKELDRNVIAEWCFKRYKYLFENLGLREVEFVYSDDGGDVFSRGGSINKGVEECRGDYIIITDADYLFGQQMARNLINKQEWTVACKQHNYYFTDHYIANYILSKPHDIDIKKIAFGKHIEVSKWQTYGQILAMPKKNFVKFYNKFRGYGFEDDVFYYCMRAWNGKEWRTNNYMFHIYHSRPIGSAYMQKSYDNIKILKDEWEEIKLDRKKMRQVMEEKGLLYEWNRK